MNKGCSVVSGVFTDSCSRWGLLTLVLYLRLYCREAGKDRSVSSNEIEDADLFLQHLCVDMGYARWYNVAFAIFCDQLS